MVQTFVIEFCPFCGSARRNDSPDACASCGAPYQAKRASIHDPEYDENILMGDDVVVAMVRRKVGVGSVTKGWV